MTLLLQCVVVICCLLLFVYAIHLIQNERLQLKYSLLWLALTLVIMICSLFPEPLFKTTQALGFATASNFIFFAGSLFMLAILFSLSSIVSKQALSIKNLSQRIGILENEFRERNNSPNESKDGVQEQD